MSLNVQALPLSLDSRHSRVSDSSIPVLDPTPSASTPTPPSSLTSQSPITDSTPVSSSTSSKNNKPPCLVSVPIPETPPGSPPLKPIPDAQSHLLLIDNSCNNSHPIPRVSLSKASSVSSQFCAAATSSLQPEIFPLDMNKVSSSTKTDIPDSDPLINSSVEPESNDLEMPAAETDTTSCSPPLNQSLSSEQLQKSGLPTNSTSSNSSMSTSTSNQATNFDSLFNEPRPVSSFDYPHNHPLYMYQESADVPISIPTVSSVAAKTLASAIDHHYSSQLPERENVFPWLHGLHKNNVSQRMFFQPGRKLKPSQLTMPDLGSGQNLNCAFDVPSNTRGLLVVKVGPPNSQGTLIGSVYPDEILARNSVGIDCDMQDSFFEDSMGTSFENSALSSSELGIDKASDRNDTLNPDNYLPEFIDVDPTDGISLRNFHIQVAKWATVSDIVFYVSDEALRSKMNRFALLVSRAQIALQKANPQIPLYSTFVVEDPIEKFLQESSHIMAVPPAGIPYDENQIKMRNWDSNFLLHENVELSMMSSASSIGGGPDCFGHVWLGNVSDYETHIETIKAYIEAGKSLEQNVSNGVVASLQEESQSTDMDSNLEADVLLEESLKRNWTFYVNCKPGVSVPSLAVLDFQIRQTLVGDLDDIDFADHNFDETSQPKSSHKWHQTNIDFPSSGTIATSTISETDVCSIISLCKLLYLRGKCMHKGHRSSSLIFCTDGYTDSSLLALCYVMYSQGITAPQAWIYIHKQCYRPIFAFPTDPQLVYQLQKHLLRYSPAVPGSLYENDRACVPNLNASQPGVKGDNEADMMDEEMDGTINKQSSTSSIEQNSNSNTTDFKDLAADDQWFASFDGSLPSLILQHMYLGSLAHANNVQMLTRLGIKRVISVGEPLNWINYGNNYNSYGDYDMDNLETSTGNSTQIIDRPYPGISKVLHINDVQDDGIDTLTDFLWECLDFLDEAEFAKEPTLVHCRVGVSRSATVCIAEVMKRLGVGLPRAYLFVRVRRLNVIIQPHLQFMFELAKWEERHRQSGKGWLREVDWPILCREIATMNRAYISS